ncbi:Na+/H+ antiporter subunit E [Sphingomonas soli]|uniref:Na+/H+ antiporter subunit E n=1 Tax=Sphingomonas soli TaxID=266127 RepID=UPI00082AD597|nr:Na+/H+ antiporter subunit E [Sphingomonas soli]
MKRWIPHPLLAAALFIMWLLLNQSVSPGHVVLGAVVALLASRAMAALRPEPVRLASVTPVLELAGLVLADVIRSNLAVARAVLFPRPRVSGFVRVPLDLTNIHGLTVLSCIVTATPGTLWVQFDRTSGVLLIHVLDLIDEEAWVRLLKTRYEARLLRIFAQ